MTDTDRTGEASGVKPDRAKKHLRSMLESFTQGSILHLLGDVFEELAQEALQESNEVTSQQYRTVAATLFAVGLGIDAACPR